MSRPDPQPPFGPVLRQLRRARDLTLEETARRGRVAANYLSDVERGRRNPTLRVTARILDGLGVTWAEFGQAVDAQSPPGFD